MPEPGIHALIVGISHYPHLRGGAEPNARIDDLGLLQPDGAATSAYRMVRWLKDNESDLPLPLASCRFLASPSERERENIPEISEAGPCTINDFVREASEWRARAMLSRNNITIFNFVGIGAQRNSVDDVLLLSDFGSDIGPLMRASATVGNLFYGMATTVDTMASTQLYFIDAGRSVPNWGQAFFKGTTDIFDVAIGPADSRTAVVFNSARPGSSAWLAKGEGSLFSRDLLQGLDGRAGTLDMSGDASSRNWAVTVNSLAHWMTIAASRTAAEYGMPEPLGYTVSGAVRDTVIRRLREPPLVAVTFAPQNIPDDESTGDTVVTLSRDDGFTRTFPLSRGVTVEIPAGFYIVSSQSASQHTKTQGQIVMVTPPVAHIVLQPAAASEPAR